MEVWFSTLQKLIQAPDIFHLPLKNGARFILSEISNAPLTCIDLWCKAGSSFEKKGEEGLAHFLEHMIFKGSQKLAEGEFDQKIEVLGGSSNAATGHDDVHYYVLIPPSAVLKATELLLDLVLTPSLKEEPFLLEKEVVLEEIAQQNDQPEERLFQQLLENCWPNHSYGKPILGLKESLLSLTTEDVRSFHNRQYQPNNIVLSLAGYIPKGIERVLENSPLESKFESTQKNKLENSCLPVCFEPGRIEIKLPRLQSARILMAWELPPAKNQLMLIGADIATSVLAEGRRSRLVDHLRENLQIVESIEMHITALEQGGLFLLEAYGLEEKLEEIQNQISFILRSALKKEVTQKEMTRAKQLVINNLCFGLELPSQISGIAASNELWDRSQPLLEPLKYINYWNSSKIKNEIFSNLQPEKSFTLIATPK